MAPSYRTLALVAALVACGPSTLITTKILNGASDADAAAGAHAGPGPDRVPGPPIAGEWSVTPDRVEIVLREVRFVPERGMAHTARLDGCVATWDRSAPTLSPLLDCALDVPHGTYVAIVLKTEDRATVWLDDPEAGLFTDGLGVVTEPPAGGAAPSVIEDLIQDGMWTDLPTPWIVDDTTDTALSVVVSGQHTVTVQVAGSAATWARSFGAMLFLSPGTVAKATYYSAAGTTSTLHPQSHGFPNELVLFYEDDATPSYAFVKAGAASAACRTPQERGWFGAWNAAPGPLNAEGQTTGGYLGRDASGTICFATPWTPDFATYDSFWWFPEATARGEVVPFSCAKADAVPAPTSGDTWASGCPAFDADATFSATLVAD